jgi:holin-like protein
LSLVIAMAVIGVMMERLAKRHASEEEGQ